MDIARMFFPSMSAKSCFDMVSTEQHCSISEQSYADSPFAENPKPRHASATRASKRVRLGRFGLQHLPHFADFPRARSLSNRRAEIGHE